MFTSRGTGRTGSRSSAPWNLREPFKFINKLKPGRIYGQATGQYWAWKER